MAKTESRNDKLRAAHDKLQAAVAEIVSGDDWKRMLKVASKFHRYSFSNHLMIFLQGPDATVVAGFNKWKSLGRFIKKGDASEEKTVQQIRGFRVVHVFDISQTEGEGARRGPAQAPRRGRSEGIWDALVGQAHAAGFEVIRDGWWAENGYCDFSHNQIAVWPDVAPAQAVKTLIHELGHALLHSDEPPRSKEVAEVEVESVAFFVCDAIGLDSGDYNFAYVARWAEGSTDLLKETGERVMACVREILQQLEASDHAMAS